MISNSKYLTVIYVELRINVILITQYRSIWNMLHIIRLI